MGALPISCLDSGRRSNGGYPKARCRPSHKHSSILLLLLLHKACYSHLHAKCPPTSTEQDHECMTAALHHAANDGQKKKEGIPQAIAAMKAAGGSIEYVTKHELNQVVDNRPHQVPSCLLCVLLHLQHQILLSCKIHQELLQPGKYMSSGLALRSSCPYSMFAFRARLTGDPGRSREISLLQAWEIAINLAGVVKSCSDCVVASMPALGHYLRKAEQRNWLLQGLVLDCSSLAWEPMDHLPSAQEAAASSTRLPVWLALDEIEDPVSSSGHKFDTAII